MSAALAEHHENFGKIYDSFEFWPKISDGATIIDIGCGGGVLTRKLATKHPSAKIIGIDVKQDLLEVAKQKAQSEGLKNIEFISGDASKDSLLKLGPVDGVFCRFLLEDLPHPAETLSYMYQVLRPGGWIAACERLNSFAKVYPDSDAIDQAWTALYHFFENEFGKSPSITNSLPHLLEKVGFTKVRSQGFSQSISKSTLGKVFEWYVGISCDMFENLSQALVNKKCIDEAVIKKAISDYKMLLTSDNSFALEVAIGISGFKPLP